MEYLQGFSPKVQEIIKHFMTVTLGVGGIFQKKAELECLTSKKESLNIPTSSRNF